MDTIKFDHSGSHVRMIAHQGIHHLETGNTCAGFVAAGNRSYYGRDRRPRHSRRTVRNLHDEQHPAYDWGGSYH